jgi:spore coat protein H
VDEIFLSKRGLPTGSIFYAVDGDANFSLVSDLDKEIKDSLELGYEKKVGVNGDDLYLQEMILRINTLLREEFAREIEKYINIDKYLRWLAGVVFTQNYDGFVHNYALYRNGNTGQFEVIPWDYDATWGRDVNGKEMDADYVRMEGFNTLTARILDVAEFRKQYHDILQHILKEQFTLDYLKPKIEMLHNLIRPFVLKDPYVKEKIESFDREPEFIYSYIEGRTKFIKQELSKFI